MQRGGRPFCACSDTLLSCAVTPYSWCWACGLEPQDVILSINEQPARSTDDLRRAILNPRANSVVLETTTPTGGCFRFCLPVPLGEPEMHCMGFLFEQDPAAGFHVVVGLLKNSIADRAGVIRGCCIRRIDGFPPSPQIRAPRPRLPFGLAWESRIDPLNSDPCSRLTMTSVTWQVSGSWEKGIRFAQDDLWGV